MAFCQFDGLFRPILVWTWGNDGKSFVLHHYRVDARREKITLRSATEW